MSELSVAGHVYVLINSSFPHLVKIGKTTGEPAERARELRTTGVPTPFVVAYSIFVDDCSLVEKQIHQDLYQFRSADDREFFRIDSKRAIDVLIRHGGAREAEKTSAEDSRRERQEMERRIDEYRGRMAREETDRLNSRQSPVPGESYSHAKYPKINLRDKNDPRLRNRF